MAIDLRTASLVDFLPESISGDPEIVALSLAIDPELQDVGGAIIEAVILPRISGLSEAILDELAWAFRMNRLQLWDDASLEGKRALLANIFEIRKKSGTKFAVRRLFDLLDLTAVIVEWWEEPERGWAPFLYRIRIFAGDVGVTHDQLIQLNELTYRFSPVRSDISELAVEDDSGATIYEGTVLTVGRHVTIPFGGP